ncbi:hypothetical protein FNYG_10521 [Fusarium nygamai]|uniref:Uncharacterized protein n=1 Tax=Gibberella nygamai TaxID=42673 RepID=A0A2K0W119_GIBNY|nr:hypothetical protein FNYG_10521 [Fusarium nygamai]
MRTEPTNEKGCMIARIDRLMRQQCAAATPEISKRGVHGANGGTPTVLSDDRYPLKT